MNDKKQNRLVIFGKGGVGKSTFACSLSAHYAMSGLSVMHIGCDPKGDSTLMLVKEPGSRSTVIELLTKYGEIEMSRDIINEGRHGIRCIEAGGPEAGTGCGGRGIARVLEYIEKWDILNRHGADVVVFDVLGDVVCGGFAAPLRKGFAEKVVVVLSEDEMSYFAANNIAKAVVRYRSNGVALAGLVVNHAANGAASRRTKDFAERIGARIIGALPRSAAVDIARSHGLTAVEFDPEDSYSRAVAAIGAELLEIERETLPRPAPMDHGTFIEWAHGIGKRPVAAAPPPTDAPAAPTSREAGRAARRTLLTDRFSALMGLNDRPFSFQGAELVSVTPEGEGFVFEIRSDRFEGVSVAVLPKGDKREGVRASNFDVVLVNGKLTNTVVKLLRNIAFRLGDFTLGALEEHYREWTATRDRGVKEQQKFPGLARTCGEKWARFFADGEFRRNAGSMLSFDIPMVQVIHRDFECGFATDCIRSDEFTACNYPWLDTHMGRDMLYSRMKAARHGYQTNIDEADVIHGATGKLGRLLDGVIDNLGDEKLVIMQSACLPTVSGEDVSSVVKAAREKCPVPLMYIGPENADSLNPLLEFFINMKKETGFKEVETVPDTINLIGFPIRKDVEELEAMLAAMGVGINAEILPIIDTTIFEIYRAARTSVALPNIFFNEIYDLIFADAPVKMIRPPAPYGVQGTRTWANAVADALGEGAVKTAAADALWENLRPEWEDMLGRAGACALGFVVDADGLERIHDASRNNGVPIMEMIAEMGFRSEFFVYCGDRKKMDAAALNAAPFATREELEKALEASGCQSIFTDYYFDHRPARAGKSQFSLQSFEMGFEGALRTIRRLVSACELPFFGRYGKYTK